MMRQGFLLGIVALLCTSCVTEKVADRFVIKRGINVSHWLSQVYDTEPVRIRYFNEQDVVFLKNSGFDHIRLPIDEERLWDEDGAPIAQSFTELHEAIGWCRNHGLRVVVDLHVIRSHHFNAGHEDGKNTLFTDPAALDHFVGLWQRISAELNAYPNGLVAYEILNEAAAPDPEDWNNLVHKAVAAIRSLEPERTIVIGSNTWQIPETFQYLKVPENDPNLILSFHLYSPLPFTHHQASWVPMHAYDGEVRYPGVPVDEAVFSQDYPEAALAMLRKYNQYCDPDTQTARMQLALDVAKAHNLPLYCGEYGCLPTVPRDMRLQWYRDVVEIMETAGVAHAAWDLKGLFGIMDRDTGTVDGEVVEILVGGQ
jgi:endoglucanase